MVGFYLTEPNYVLAGFSLDYRGIYKIIGSNSIKPALDMAPRKARTKFDKRIPSVKNLIGPTFIALNQLGGSGNNEEILEQVIRVLEIDDEVAEILHTGSSNKTEISYRADWARTALRKWGAIENSARSVWSITSAYSGVSTLTPDDVQKAYEHLNKSEKAVEDPTTTEGDDTELPEELRPWRERLLDILQNMDPYGFERLAQRVLRECGFSQVEVTKKSGDGGIDGTGKLRINGIFSFNVAFQCKRYKGMVGAPEIRDFRGSLTTNIEKGVMITTGSFSKAAREEAASPGKQQILKVV